MIGGLGLLARRAGANLAPYRALVLVVLIGGLTSWALLERDGKLSAKNQVEDLEGKLELSYERQREQNRAVTALGSATTAAQARLAQLERDRVLQNGPLVASITRLEAAIASKEPFTKGCGDALREAREGR